MSKLRAILETPVGPKRIPVTHEVPGEVPVLDKDGKPEKDAEGKAKTKKGKVTEELAAVFGMPDATYLALQQWDEGKKALRAALWTAELANRHGGELPIGINPFTAEDVFPVMLVTHYLETPKGEEPLTDIEVAHYSKEHGMDFGKLYAAALQIVGGTDEAQGLDPTASVGVKNSLRRGATAQVVACVRAIHRHPYSVVREVRAAHPDLDEDSVQALAFSEIAEACAAQAIIDAAEYDQAERIRTR